MLCFLKKVELMIIGTTQYERYRNIIRLLMVKNVLRMKVLSYGIQLVIVSKQ